MTAIDLIGVVYALVWLGIAAAIVAFPVWLSLQIVAAVRARQAVSWRTRIGDREREALTARLADDYAAGRIPFREFEGRVEEAWQAATYSDLRAIAIDLPPAQRPRTFTVVDLVLAFAAGLAAIGVSAFAALLLAFGIVLRRRAR